MTDTKFYDDFRRYREKATNAHNELSEKYKSFSSDDPRRMIAFNFKSTISSAQLMALSHDNFCHQIPDSWFDDNGFDVKQKTLEDYVMYLGWGNIIHIFSVFETGIRRIVRSIDPNACSNGNSNFESIYVWLFKRLQATGWKFSKGCGREFLDLFRNVRNTIHNNGKFFPPSNKDSKASWQGVDYEFKVGKNLDFKFDFVFMLIEDLIDLNKEMMQSNLIAQLPAIA